jgi:cellulose synthase/poly-beta-1,6-N-acetylglucosamine synthase-like glycosyltransferase
MRILLIIFLLSSILLLYVYAGYPALMYVASKINDQKQQNPVKPETAPSVTLIVAAYNEEDIIENKIENSLSIQYPGDLEIVVFSDASSDDTDEIVRSYESQVKLERIEGRVGKTECQNQVVAQTDSDVVVFSDANSIYEPDAITELVRGIKSGADCVIGELQYQGGQVSEESLYWRIERAIKRGESATGNVVAGNGAIYAVERESYIPLPSDEISDFAEPLAILRNSGRIKYNSSAIATEQTSDNISGEFSRRVRISTRAWHTMAKYRELLSPMGNLEISIKLLSHKVLRWLTPIYFGTILLLSVSLSYQSRLFTILLVAETLLLSIGIIGWIAEQYNLSIKSATVSIPQYLLIENIGLLIGGLNLVRGKNIVSWETTDRND